MTLCLLERPFASVNSPVVDPSWAVSECCITGVTLVGALSCVDTHVAFERLFLAAGAPTHCTDKWCRCVESHVLLQALLPQKPVLTHLTLKVLLREMNNHVTLEKHNKWKQFHHPKSAKFSTESVFENIRHMNNYFYCLFIYFRIISE
jgi:hypothetical protein